MHRNLYKSHTCVCTDVAIAYCHQNEKIATKEGNVRFWLGEHLLEVYSVHQHGEGELIDKETVEMQ